MHRSGGLIKCSIPQQYLYSTLTVRAGALSTAASRQQSPCDPLPLLAANMTTDGACTPSVRLKPQAFLAADEEAEVGAGQDGGHQAN